MPVGRYCPISPLHAHLAATIAIAGRPWSSWWFFEQPSNRVLHAVAVFGVGEVKYYTNEKGKYTFTPKDQVFILSYADIGIVINWFIVVLILFCFCVAFPSRNQVAMFGGFGCKKLGGKWIILPEYLLKILRKSPCVSRTFFLIYGTKKQNEKIRNSCTNNLS